MIINSPSYILYVYTCSKLNVDNIDFSIRRTTIQIQLHVTSTINLRTVEIAQIQNLLSHLYLII